jgi:prepilin-type N-terminal cleavage/methylation domain-containing protein
MRIAMNARNTQRVFEKGTGPLSDHRDSLVSHTEPRVLSPFRTPSQRRGFTLVELLVVIAIIAILASLIVVAVFKWIDQQQHSNSEAQVRAVHEVLKRHWNYVVSKAKDEPIPSFVTQLAGGDTDRARIIWIKLRLTEAFPMTYYEVQFPGIFYDHGNKLWIYLIPPDKSKSTGYRSKIKTLIAPDRNTESAACLLVALSVARGEAAALSMDNLPVPAVDTDGDDIKELVDGFGRPLAFFRFPTSHPELVAISGGDPQDPKRKLLTASWNSGNRRIFQEVTRYTPALNPTAPYFTTPVIMSRGINGDKDGASVKLLEAKAPLPPAGNPNPPPTSPYVTFHDEDDYPDMRILDAAQEKDNIYSFKLGAPQ